MKIQVLSRDLGFWTQEPITVVLRDEDGDLCWCNHAGAEEVEEECAIYRPDLPDIVWQEKRLECDKCGAWKLIVGDEGWRDAPAEGLHYV